MPGPPGAAASLTWPLLAPGDSATAPSYAWSGDAATGFYHSNPGQVAISGDFRVDGGIYVVGVSEFGNNTQFDRQVTFWGDTCWVDNTSFNGPGAVPYGGNAGQVLTKNSNTAYDVVWANVPAPTITWPLTAPIGSAGAPSYGFVNGGTGMYQPASNQLGFAVGGVAIIRASSTAVGIGVAPGVNTLDVTGTLHATGNVQFGGTLLAGATTITTLSASGLITAQAGVSVTGGAATGNGTVPTGGTTNQVLAKTSNSDYALAWVNQTGGGAVTFPLLGPADTAGAPNYSFTASTSSGLYSPAANQSGLAAGGVGTLRVSSTGVGILQAPSANALGVTGNANVAGQLNCTGNGAIGGTVGTNAVLTVGGGSLSGTIQYGISAIATTFSSAATASGSVLALQFASQNLTYTMANGYGVWVQASSTGASSTITTLHGLRVDNQGTARVGTAYGLYVAAQSGATTANIGIYNGGTSQLVGNVAIGGAVSASQALVIQPAATLTGTSQWLMVANGTLSSAATTAGYGLYVSVVLQAATFTMTSGYGIQITTPALGAGSALTTAYGINIANQGQTGTTNAYGVYIQAQSGAATTNIGLQNLGSSRFDGPLSMGTAPNSYVGIQMYLSISSVAGGGAYGVTSQPAFTASGNNDNLYCVLVAIQSINRGAFTGVQSFGISVGNMGSAGVAASYGIQVQPQSGSTNNYGIYNQASSWLATYTAVGTTPATNIMLLAKGATADNTQDSLLCQNSSGTRIFECRNDNAIGFFSTGINLKQTITGSKASNAALASLITALASYGLVTDSTT